ncbi:MAG TPA: DUF72 domain-containing protein [Casimicrobiaceae bacterium]|nr:DUF72 domain-containing protein [Casimicrobiaceae bacterium]
MQRSHPTSTTAIRIGVSGWRYPPWRGVFYPKGLQQRRELEFASRVFPSIELNGSFYSLQRPENYATWYTETPAGFVFSVKAPRFITHIKRLRDIDAPLANFFASGVANLREKLGPILWQLPPTMRYDAPLLENFLASLPRDTDAASRLARRHDARVSGRARIAFGPVRRMRHALEMRHPSFVDPGLVDQLRRHEVALVIADTAGKWPQVGDVTSNFVYIRLHGDEELYRSAYIEPVLTQWAARIRAWADGGEPRGIERISHQAAAAHGRREVFCYFDNTDKVEAPANARRLMEKLKVEWSAPDRLPSP